MAVLSELRHQMQQQGLDALIVPRADEFLGEYIPESNERMRFISKFTGSAGLVIVTLTNAAVFVDGRYTVQVKRQVDTADFEIGDLSDAHAMAWVEANTDVKGKIGVDAKTVCQTQFERWQSLLDGRELLDTQQNVIDAVWADRPEVVARQGFSLAERYTGESSLSKRTRLGQTLQSMGLDGFWVFLPESVSWLLNVRGSDIPQLPILQSHALLQADGSVQWFIESSRLPADWQAHVGTGVTAHNPSELESVLASCSGQNVGADPLNTNAASWQTMLAQGVNVIAKACPIMAAKAAKNGVEVEGTRQAHKRDAAAKAAFLAWIDESVAAGKFPDEAELADKLHEFRCQNPEFLEPSFSTISAAGPNGALCHYNHRNGLPGPLVNDSLYLVDSGGQYLDGTTDVTRTVAIGQPTPEMRRNFTLVLKGHIALARIRFPRGTSGMQLDSLARQFLWQHELDFEHGTGHGVGSYLSVHEGPQRIAKLGSPTPLEEGMIVSNEPGYYEEDQYGIRCENLQVVVPGERDGFYAFETLTLLPFDCRLMVLDMLTADEISWINQYHARVNNEISPLVDSATRDWLQRATAPLPL